MDSGQIILFQKQGGETKIKICFSNEAVTFTGGKSVKLLQGERSTI